MGVKDSPIGPISRLDWSVSSERAHFACGALFVFLDFWIIICNMRNWYVVTGAPSAGKTTLLNDLGRRGLHVEEEAARTYIDEQIKMGHSVSEIRADEERFQKKVYDLKLKLESRLSTEETIFFDRGLPDTLAYYRLHGFEMPAVMETNLKAAEYKKVFLLEPLSTYDKDYSRTESKEEAAILHELLKESYKQTSSEIITIPAMLKEERLAHVLQVLREDGIEVE
jgi:predicted ATPase